MSNMSINISDEAVVVDYNMAYEVIYYPDWYYDLPQLVHGRNLWLYGLPIIFIVGTIGKLKNRFQVYLPCLKMES